MAEIYYRDPAKQAKLEDAIRYGFINRELGSDGIYTYTLTPAGITKWMTEKMVSIKF